MMMSLSHAKLCEWNTFNYSTFKWTTTNLLFQQTKTQIINIWIHNQIDQLIMHQCIMHEIG